MFFLNPSMAISPPAKGVVSAAKTPSKLLVMEVSFFSSRSFLDVLQVFLAQPEIMADFVEHTLPDPFLDLIFRGGKAFDRLLIDNNNIGGDIAVIGTAVHERDAVIEPEQRAGRGSRRAAAGRALRGQDGPLLDPFSEFSGGGSGTSPRTAIHP